MGTTHEEHLEQLLRSRRRHAAAARVQKNGGAGAALHGRRATLIRFLSRASSTALPLPWARRRSAAQLTPPHRRHGIVRKGGEGECSPDLTYDLDLMSKVPKPVDVTYSNGERALNVILDLALQTRFMS